MKRSRSGDAARSGLTSITVMPVSRATASFPRPAGRRPCPWDRARRRHLRAPWAKPCPEATEALEVLVRPGLDHEEDLLGLPGHDVGVEAKLRARVEVRPPPLELAEIQPRVLARAKIAVTTGTKAPGAPCSWHGEGVANDRDSLRGQGLDPGHEGLHVGLLGRAPSPAPCRPGCPRFFSPQLVLAARDLPLGRGRPEGRSAGLPLELPGPWPGRPRGAGQAQLAEVDGQAEGGVKANRLLEMPSRSTSRFTWKRLARART